MEKLVEFLRQSADEGQVIVLMGAGDIFRVWVKRSCQHNNNMNEPLAIQQNILFSAVYNL